LIEEIPKRACNGSICEFATVGYRSEPPEHATRDQPRDEITGREKWPRGGRHRTGAALAT